MSDDHLTVGRVPRFSGAGRGGDTHKSASRLPPTPAVTNETMTLPGGGRSRRHGERLTLPPTLPATARHRHGTALPATAPADPRHETVRRAFRPPARAGRSGRARHSGGHCWRCLRDHAMTELGTQPGRTLLCIHTSSGMRP